MRLRNKKTGEIIETMNIGSMNERGEAVHSYSSLAELTEEWEDVPEEPKEDGLDNIIALVEAYSSRDSERYPKEIVKKLKAWQRLKDAGFKFINFPYKKICKYDARTGVGNLEYQVKYYEELESDLDLLSGGEE